MFFYFFIFFNFLILLLIIFFFVRGEGHGFRSLGHVDASGDALVSELSTHASFILNLMRHNNRPAAEILSRLMHMSADYRYVYYCEFG